MIPMLLMMITIALTMMVKMMSTAMMATAA